jgi:hypothetical protein
LAPVQIICSFHYNSLQNSENDLSFLSNATQYKKEITGTPNKNNPAKYNKLTNPNAIFFSS